MGSKRAMLVNGLGGVLRDWVPKADRFVDLFSGSGAVASYVAERWSIPVLAVDLQEYSRILSGAIIGRAAAVETDELEQTWLEAGSPQLPEEPAWVELYESGLDRFKAGVMRARRQAANSKGQITRAYGGHYFSVRQAQFIDSLLTCLPADGDARLVCHAALIRAASYAAASPGHTAQPFQPTAGAGTFLAQAWLRDVKKRAAIELRDIGPRYAQIKGAARVGSAIEEAASLTAGDLVLLDPPYSDVQYSRFYHVLESVARRNASAVMGVGRYPPRLERPQSDFSRSGKALKAMADLLEAIAVSQATVVVTFPAGNTSVGYAGSDITALAKRWYRVEHQTISGLFSTLGGDNSHRMARVASSELIIVLRPKRSRRQRDC